MPGFFEKLRESAGKATFEADRLRRLSREQSVLRSLKRELDARTAATGQQALALYDSGTLAQPELLTTCEQIVLLRQQTTDQEAKVERIRQERPPEALPPASYGHICPQCRTELPAIAVFCPQCGSQAMDVAPPSLAAVKSCSRCGADLTPGALFCSQCGVPVKEEVLLRAVETPAQLVCPDCQALIPAEADFCLMCGKPVSSALLEGSRQDASLKARPLPLKKVCPHCHTLIPDEAIFCPECGKPATSAPAELVKSEVSTAFRKVSSPPAWAAEVLPPVARDRSLPAEPIAEQISPAVTDVRFPVVPGEKEGSSAAEGVLPPSELVKEELAPTIEQLPSRSTCHTCQASIPSEAVLCPACGTPLASTSPQSTEGEALPAMDKSPTQMVCPICRTSIPIEADFCPECGTPVASSPPEWR